MMPMHDAAAAALQVSPIRVDLSADTPAAVLTLHNEGNAPIDAQVRVFAWTQSLDDDVLTPTTVIVASPPIVRLAPNADQTVRILRVSSEPIAREESYRLLIDEIPNAQSAQADGVHVQLRYSVPVFALAQHATLPALSFSLERDDTALRLRASNDSDVHAQLSRVSIEWPDGRTSTVSDGLLGYALPHASRRWIVTNAPASLNASSHATLHALVNGEPVTVRIVVKP
jgi:fimbrial chaperone protein